MKKIVVILFIISIIFILNNKQELIIPKESIRFRIIANSNNLQDQALKNNIKKDLLENLTINYNSIENARDSIINNIPILENKLSKYNTKYSINYGNNYFPDKEYKGVIYPRGKYESLVITLGDGLGDNYWCVLYPPLCLVEDNNTNKIEYKSLISDIINKYN